MSIKKLRWEKRKYFIRINCWIMILLFVAILLLMGFPIVSNADSPTYLKDKYFMHDLINSQGFVSKNGQEGYYNLPTNGSTFTNFRVHFVDSYDIYQSLYYDSVKSLFDNVSCDSLVSLSNNSINSLDDFDNLNLIIFTKSDDNDFLYFAFNKLTSSPDGFNIDFGHSNQIGGRNNGYYSYNLSTKGLSFYQSNPSCQYVLYCSYKLYNYSDNNKINVNYTYIDGSVGQGSGGASIEPDTYEDGSGGDSVNNLYMKTADWKFNIPKYWGNVSSESVQPQYESSWGSGSIMFYGLLNDYQKANSSDFNLNFNFHIWCAGHYFSDVNSNINGNFYGSFNYNNVTVSLNDFINGNNTKTWSIIDIFEHAVNSSGDDFNDWLNDNVKGHNSINNWNWYISCDACLVASGSSSGHIVEKYNFISQMSQEQSNSITTNNNPYIPPSDSGYDPDINTNNPDNGTTTTSSNGNITINNNPTFTNNNGNSNMNTVNNGNGNPFNTLIDKLFGDGTVQEGSIGSNTQNQLLSTTGASRWLAVMNDSMSWIPAGVWAEIMMFLGVSLGILVVAFILRIILDFL